MTVDRSNPQKIAKRASAPRQRMDKQLDGGQVAQADGIEDYIDGDDTQLVASVTRALQVLNAFRPGDRPLGNVELTERTGLTKPTVSRLAYTLSRCGYLSFNPRFRVYTLGPNAIALGNTALASISVRALARPLMQQLATHARFNVGLGTRDRHLMVYTDAFEGESLVGVRLFAGSRIPVLTTAMGRAYLCGLDEEERERVVHELKPKYGEQFVGLKRGLLKAVAEVAREGFCASFGEWQTDIHGVAAPIRGAAGEGVYALNLGGPAYLLPEVKLREELGPRVARIAQAVQKQITPDLVSSTP